jgi:hypothetical protein
LGSAIPVFYLLGVALIARSYAGGDLAPPQPPFPRRPIFHTFFGDLADRRPQTGNHYVKESQPKRLAGQTEAGRQEKRARPKERTTPEVRPSEEIGR